MASSSSVKDLEEKSKRTFDNLLLQINKKMEEKDYKEALRIIDSCLSSSRIDNPTFLGILLSGKKEVLFHLSVRAESNCNTEEFMNHTDAMLLLDPQCREAWELKARFFRYKMKKYDDAFRAAIEAVKLGSKMVGVLVDAGEGYMLSYDYKSALGTFERALELAPDKKDKKFIKAKIRDAKKKQVAHDELLERAEKETDAGTCSSKMFRP